MSHGKIDKINLGHFNRNEVAFYGTTCSAMSELFDFVNQVNTKNKLVYIDGDHKEREACISKLIVGNDDVNYRSNRTWSKYDYAFSLNEFDLAVVNGNHFQANTQVIICDLSKQGSLERRASELTNVKAIVSFDETAGIPDYVKNLVPNYSSLPFLKSKEELALWLSKVFLQPAALEALILGGGKSLRMGEDKSQIEYHGIAQWKYLSLCMEDLGLPLHISCREDQREIFSRKGANLLLDRVKDIGPIGGLISAFMHDSSKAYLTIACDLPNVDSAFLFELISQRDPSAFATAFVNSEKGWPEPLITIWEPRSFLRIMQFVGVGNTCPRKVLMNSPVKLIEPSDQRFLLNVNNPEERDKVLFAK
jgi:molybdopterin-guanine dinucleotide biosynthesis protein A